MYDTIREALSQLGEKLANTFSCHVAVPSSGNIAGFFTLDGSTIPPLKQVSITYASCAKPRGGALLVIDYIQQSPLLPILFGAKVLHDVKELFDGCTVIDSKFDAPRSNGTLLLRLNETWIDKLKLDYAFLPERIIYDAKQVSASDTLDESAKKTIQTTSAMLTSAREEYSRSISEKSVKNIKRPYFMEWMYHQYLKSIGEWAGGDATARFSHKMVQQLSNNGIDLHDQRAVSAAIQREVTAQVLNYAKDMEMNATTSVVAFIECVQQQGESVVRPDRATAMGQLRKGFRRFNERVPLYMYGPANSVEVEQVGSYIARQVHGSAQYVDQAQLVALALQVAAWVADPLSVLIPSDRFSFSRSAEHHAVAAFYWDLEFSAGRSILMDMEAIRQAAGPGCEVLVGSTTFAAGNIVLTMCIRCSFNASTIHDTVIGTLAMVEYHVKTALLHYGTRSSAVSFGPALKSKMNALICDTATLKLRKQFYEQLSSKLTVALDSLNPAHHA